MSSESKILQTNNRKSECGYLYVSTHLKYVYEICISVKSLRKVDPNANVTLIFGDILETLEREKTIDISLFDHIIYQPLSEKEVELKEKGIPNFSYKGMYIYDLTPYEKTLCLDGDTYFCDNVLDVFEMLDYFDICIAQALMIYKIEKLSFRVYNGGVLAFRKVTENKIFFKHFAKNLKERMPICDQLIFMEILALENIRPKLYILSNNYNLRISYTTSIGRGKVKILHGHHSEEEFIKIEKKVNKIPIYLQDLNIDRIWEPQSKYFLILNHWLQYINSFLKKYLGKYKFYKVVLKIGRKIIRMRN